MYKENEEVIETERNIDPDFLEKLNMVSNLIGYDLKDLGLKNDYDFNIFLSGPSRFLDNVEICRKVEDLKFLLEMGD